MFLRFFFLEQNLQRFATNLYQYRQLSGIALLWLVWWPDCPDGDPSARWWMGDDKSPMGRVEGPGKTCALPGPLAWRAFINFPEALVLWALFP